MFELPPIRGEALAVLVGTSLLIMLLAALANGPGGPVPKTGLAALLVALLALQWVFICFGSLASAALRNWLFKPSQALENATLGLWVGGVGGVWLTAQMLHRAWQLFHQASQ